MKTVETNGSKGYLDEKQQQEEVIPSITTTVAYLKEFQNRHQLLAWKQYATVEHKHYKIHKMDLRQKTLLVERLDDYGGGGSETNGKVAGIVRMSALGEKGVRN